ncbi:MAG: type VI secretion system tube protein Hcp [Planctomycetota bacterium]
MASYFLNIQDLPGESRDDEYAGHIEVLDFENRVQQKANPSAGGMTDAHCDHTPLKVKKMIDKASPQLAQWCSQGQPIGTVTLFLRRATGAEPHTYMKYELTDVVVASLSVDGVTEESKVPTETVEFRYDTIKWTYNEQGLDHSAGGNTTGGWSISKHKAI